MTRNKNHGRNFGDKPGYKPPQRIRDGRDAAEAARQPPTEDTPRGNQQASNARGRALEPASTSRRPDESASRGSAHRDGSPSGDHRREDGAPSRGSSYQGGPAPRGKGNNSFRPPQKHNHGRPQDSEGRREDKVARRQRLHMVSEMEVIEFVNPQGHSVAVDAVNCSPGGGYQDNIATMAGNDSWMIKSNDPSHAAGIISMGLDNGASSYVARIDMVYDDDVARARRNRQIDRKIDSSSDRRRKPKVRLPDSLFGKGPPIVARVTFPQGRPAAEEPTAEQPVDEMPVDEEPAAEDRSFVDMGEMGQYDCANCGESGHNMDRCLLVPEGQLHGCVLCHTRSHCTDECHTFEGMTLQQKVKVLIFDRYSLPPLKTRVHWYQWLCQWLSHPDSRDAELRAYVPTGFPWSDQYTLNLGRGYTGNVRDLQEEFDRHRDVALLPKDPATATMDAVTRSYGQDHIHPDAPSTLRNAAPGRFDQPAAPVEKAAEPTGSPARMRDLGPGYYDEDMDTAPVSD